MKKFAIITICLNMEDVIGETIASILNQTCSDFEYIIKDGLSKDRTVEIAKSFEPAFVKRRIPYRIISQSDQGIYDAMNQAVREVQGEWVIYMNAGDQMADPYVLSTVEKKGCLDISDIVYGDRIDCSDAGYFYRKALPLERMRDRMPFCHQSVFARKSLYDNNSYSLRYCLCSDYRLFYDWYQEGKRFTYVPIAISIYDMHGVTSNGKKVAQELLKVHEDMPVRDEEVIQFIKDEIEGFDHHVSGVRRYISKLIPQKIRSKRWELIRKAKGWKTKEEFFAERAKNGGRVNKEI